MYFEVIGTAPLTYNSSLYDEDIIEVNYLSADRFPSPSTEYTVASYNTTTGEVTIVETTLTPPVDFIGKYIYISSGSTAKYQQR